MAVRFTIEITSGKAKAEAVALANSGYEAETPEVVVPLSFARDKLKVRSRGRKETFVTVGQRKVDFRVLGQVSISVSLQGKTPSNVQATLIAAENETEIILNDALVEALGVQLVHVKRGTWRFFDDPSDLERPSSPRQPY